MSPYDEDQTLPDPEADPDLRELIRNRVQSLIDGTSSPQDLAFKSLDPRVQRRIINKYQKYFEAPENIREQNARQLARIENAAARELIRRIRRDRIRAPGEKPLDRTELIDQPLTPTERNGDTQGR